MEHAQGSTIIEDDILWRDRKRILGMPITFTRYSADAHRLYVKKGLFSLSVDELLVYRVLDIKMTRSLGQRLFGVGTVILFTADQSTREIRLENIRKPEAVRKFLSRLIEHERDLKGVTGREMYGAAGAAAAAMSFGHRPGPENGPAPEFFKDIDGDGIPG